MHVALHEALQRHTEGAPVFAKKCAGPSERQDERWRNGQRYKQIKGQAHKPRLFASLTSHSRKPWPSLLTIPASSSQGLPSPFSSQLLFSFRPVLTVRPIGNIYRHCSVLCYFMGGRGNVMITYICLCDWFIKKGYLSKMVLDNMEEGGGQTQILLVLPLFCNPCCCFWEPSNTAAHYWT